MRQECVSKIVEIPAEPCRMALKNVLHPSESVQGMRRCPSCKREVAVGGGGFRLGKRGAIGTCYLCRAEANNDRTRE